jgi:hypothetical protein
MAQNLLALLWYALRPLLPFIFEAVVGAYVLYRLIPHSLAVSAHSEVGASRFRFSVQNNEDVPFLGPFGIRIRLLGRNVRFNGHPKVFAGCKGEREDQQLSAAMNPTRNEWMLKCPSLPAYENWIITCAATGITTAEMSVVGGQNRLRVDPVEVCEASPSAVIGSTRTPSAWLWPVMAAFGVVTYLIPIVLQFPMERIYWWDWVVCGSIVLFASVVFHFIRQDSPLMVQGFWRPSEVLLDQP